MVSEAQVRAAVRILAQKSGLVAEGAGALALAAALDTRPEDRGLTACLITGGNIEAQLLEELTGAAPE